jgi:hypothetical protein
MLPISQNEDEGAGQATSGNNAAHMANNPKAIPAAVMYARIVSLALASIARRGGLMS